MKKISALLFFCLLFGFSTCFGADTSLPMAPPSQPDLLTKLTVLAGFSLLPFAMILLTSFLKMVIVLSLVRNAMGVQQAPPNQAINGIAIIMAIYVMAPTCLAMYQEAKVVIDKEVPTDLLSGPSAQFLMDVADKAKEPLRTFLAKNTSATHEKLFFNLAYKNFPEDYRTTLKETDFIILIPAYITSQVKGAFETGVLIYLPFFVIDLVTSNILLAMGMMMLSPLTISLPLKLLLLVMVDGWTLIIQGLVLTYR
jgi:type III secretion protein R